MEENNPTTYPKKIPHAYREFEGTYLWSIVDKAVDFLERHQDILIKTRRVYIVGFLCKSMAEGNRAWLLRQDSSGTIGQPPLLPQPLASN